MASGVWKLSNHVLVAFMIIGRRVWHVWHGDGFEGKGAEKRVEETPHFAIRLLTLLQELRIVKKVCMVG